MTVNHHHDTIGGMVEKRRGGTPPREKKQVLIPVRLDEDQGDALRRWAKTQDRTVAAQVRIALGEVIPREFYQFPTP